MTLLEDWPFVQNWPFLHLQRADEVEISIKIFSVRIQIERVIGLLKNRYVTLKGIMHIRAAKSIKDELLEIILDRCDKIVTLCAALIDLG